METKHALVLVIEEHPLMRASLCATISAEPDLAVLEPDALTPDAFKFQVSSRHDTLFVNRKPDAILFSLGNPGLDDLHALRLLHNTWSGVPILALTRDELPGQEQQALACGARAALGKSANRFDLLRALRAVL